MLIYKATNTISGKSYIGKTSMTIVKRRQGHHDYASPAKLTKDSCVFHKAIASYGRDKFIWEILAETDNHADLNLLEFKLIKEHNTRYPAGYNMTDGGDGMHGYTQSPETKAKIASSVSALHTNPEYTSKLYPKLKGLTPPNKGVPMSEEQKIKVSISKKAVYANPHYINPNIGQVRTEEQKANIKAGQTGNMATGDAWHKAHDNQYTEEVRAKMRAAKIGKKPANTMQVQCIETGQIFKGLTEASKALGINRQSIWLQIKGKLKAAGKLHFQYVTT